MQRYTCAVIGLIAFCVVFVSGPGRARAQHLDVLVQQTNGKLVTGGADFDTGQWAIGRHVFSGEFDSDFAVNSPGYNSLAAGSTSLPAGSQALPGNSALGWDFLPITIGPLSANLFYWNGLESDNVPGLSPGDVVFGALSGPNYSLTIFDQSGSGFAVNGSNAIAPGGTIDDTAADGSLHRHRFYLLQDGDGNAGTLPADGIYLFAMQMRMNGLTSADPVFMVFGTPGSSVAALDDAAVPWVELGDYNGNGKVDAADYVVWRKGGTLKNEVVTPNAASAGDYTEWRARFGNPIIAAGSGTSLAHAVPESVAWPIFVFGIWSWLFSRIRRNHTRDRWHWLPPLFIFNGAFRTLSQLEGDSP